MKIIEDYPKTWDKYKQWLISKFQKENDSDKHVYFQDHLVKTSVLNTPMSSTRFFDELNIIGSVCYNGLEERFELSINGVALENDNEDINHEIVGDKDRKKAELILMQEMFKTLEKTL